MDKALLFYEGDPILVTAEEVLEGKYSMDAEFVDAEYPDYKVRFVCAGRPVAGETVGKPYFRLYYSYEDYKRLYPDRADKYEIVANMRRFQESKWHREWKERLSSFCETEKYFKSEKRWKFADAYDQELDTCIEIQHSYASFEFEDRNKFYAGLGKKIVWIFHLPIAQVRESSDGVLEILEDNARGFFRAAYETENKFNNVAVFIQTKTDRIYRVKELFRRKGGLDNRVATVRFFNPSGTWTVEEWIEDLRMGRLQSDEAFVSNGKSVGREKNRAYRITELWNENFKLMKVYSEDDGKAIVVFRDKQTGRIKRDYDYDCVRYQYAGYMKKFYNLSRERENMRIWKFIEAQTIDGEWV